MPLKIESTDRKIVLVCGLILSLLAVSMAVFSPETDETGGPPSSYSSKSGGAKAAYLLLEGLGKQPRRWSEVPSALPAESQRYTLVLVEPSRPMTAQDREALNRFVQNGGRVLVSGYIARELFGLQPIIAADLPSLSWKRYPALIPSDITSSAPEIEMPERFRMSPATSGEAMYGDSEDSAVVVRRPFGQGEAIWWSSAVPLTNAGIRKPGNAELFLNSLGESRTILWDEYFHGSSTPGWSAMKSTPLGWAILQIALFMGAVLITFSRRSTPIIEPMAQSRLSSMEFVENLGHLYQRARATTVTVDVALQRFHLHSVPKLGLPSGTSPEAVAAAVATRTGLDRGQVERTLSACESGRFSIGMSEAEALELVRRLQSYATEINRSHFTNERP